MEKGKQQIITAYLNQNFYGNQSYGVKAAAKGYFGKSLADLTLAQDATPRRHPAVADEVRPRPQRRGDLPRERRRRRRMHQVQAGRAAGQRDRHPTQPCPRPDEDRSTLTRGKHTAPSSRRPRPSRSSCASRSRPTGRRRTSSGRSGASWAGCSAPDRRTTAQRSIPPAGRSSPRSTWRCSGPPRNGSTSRRAPRTRRTRTPSSSSRKISKADRSWILGLRGHNINNAAAAVTDYRTGEVLAYAGSASYTSKGNKKFQPQFDVLADGWRQPGSAIKPVDYVIGIDDKTLTASTMLMDVDDELRWRVHADPGGQAGARPGPRPIALQFSLNIPAIKATIMSGLDHVYDRTKDFGLTYPKTAAAGPVDGDRDARGPPDRPARARTAPSPMAASGCRAGSSARSSTAAGRSGRWPTSSPRGRRS